MDAALQRQLARERFFIPNATPAQVPDPVIEVVDGNEQDIRPASRLRTVPSRSSGQKQDDPG